MPRIAVIGMGMRLSGMLETMRAIDPEAEITAVVDPNTEQTRERLRWEKMPRTADAKIYAPADEMLQDADRFDGVAIGTLRCHLHAPMAVKVAATGLPLFLEKPVAITWEQLVALATAFRGREDTVVVSFPLRLTPLFEAARKIVLSGRLGTITQVQAINNVPYGGVYFGTWYRNYNEVGGLWLQKATHDFDYINRLIGERPLTVAATVTRKVFGGDKPHDLVCSKCDLTETCMESPQNLKLRGDGGGMKIMDHPCTFSREIKNEDAGSAILQYEGGVHASYSQNFVTRRSAGRRGAIITGYSGTLEFDWFTDQIRVVDHHGSTRVDRIDVKPGDGHGGGDYILCRMFMDLLRQKGKSTANLRDGLLSAAMCLAARDSSDTNTFQSIPTVEEIPSRQAMPT